MKMNTRQLQYGSFKAVQRVGFAALLFVLALGLSGAAQADWSADSLGEGSGLDRGGMVAMNGEASLRASIERTTQMQQQIANSLDYTASAGGSFGSGGIGVMAVSAGGGEDMED